MKNKMMNSTKATSRKPTIFNVPTYLENTTESYVKSAFGPDSIQRPTPGLPSKNSLSEVSHGDDLRNKVIFSGISGLICFILGIIILLPIAWKLMKKKRYARRYNSVPVELERTMCAAAQNLDPNTKNDDEWRKLQQTNRDVRLSLESYGGCSDDDCFRMEYFDEGVNESKESPDSENTKLPIPRPAPEHHPPDPGSNFDDNGGKVGDMITRYIKQFQTLKSQYKTPPQTNYTCNNFAIGSFDSCGGLLELSHLDVSLYVPPGSLPDEKTQDLFMYVSWDNADLPLRDPNKIPVSPIIWCGQHGTNFKGHVVLSFPQNMEDPNGNCKYRVMRSDTDVTGPTNWVDVTDKKDNCVIPMKQRCLLLVDHFTGHSVVVESGPKTVKKLQVGVFGETLMNDDELYQLKVRVWADGSENPKLQAENVLDDIRSLETINNGEPICVNISKVSRGWELDKTYEEISFAHFWTAYSESVTFMAERISPQPSSFFTVVDVYQKNMSSPASKRKFKPLIKSQDPKPDQNSNKVMDDVKTRENKTQVNGNKRLSADEVFLNVEMRLKPTERLCSQLREDTAKRLSVLLDPLNPTGNDWRMLAEKFDLSYENIHWIEKCTSSPTMTVLNVLAAIYQAELTNVLKNHFTEMGHDACLKLLETCDNDRQTETRCQHQLARLKLELDDEEDETARKTSGSEESGYSSPSSSRTSSRALSLEVNFEGENPCISPTNEKFEIRQQSGVPPSSDKSKKGYMV